MSVFGRTVGYGERALWAIAGCYPSCRTWPADAPLGAPPCPSVAVASLDRLASLSEGYRRAYADACSRLGELGWRMSQVDVAPLLEAGALLYGGAFVAERYAAVGSFIESCPDQIDPAVREIILGGRSIPAERYVAHLQRLDQLRQVAREALSDFDALMLPTVPFHPTIEEVSADPIEVNSRLGEYVSFCNLLDMCGVSVPAGEADGGCFGLTVYSPAFRDRVVAELAARFTSEA